MAEGESAMHQLLDRGGDSGDCGGDRGTGTAAGVGRAPRLTVQSGREHDSPKQGTGPASQSFADIQGVTQRFADDLGRLKADHQTVSPAELARQANAEPSYRVSAVAEPRGPRST